MLDRKKTEVERMNDSLYDACICIADELNLPAYVLIINMLIMAEKRGSLIKLAYESCVIDELVRSTAIKMIS